jgi:uncharacterized protein YndB with AHSA1/START domain
MPDLRGYEVAAHGDREIRGTREFDAPRAMVWDAFTKPELLKRWLTGPDGWAMTVCEVDLRVGGTYRYVWVMEKEKHVMGMGGSFLEIARPARLVSTEKFEQPWYPGEMVGTLELDEKDGKDGKDGKTVIRQTFRYESRESRDAVLKTPMESGMAASYRNLDALLAGMGPAGSRREGGTV